MGVSAHLPLMLSQRWNIRISSRTVRISNTSDSPSRRRWNGLHVERAEARRIFRTLAAVWTTGAVGCGNPDGTFQLLPVYPAGRKSPVGESPVQQVELRQSPLALNIIAELSGFDCFSSPLRFGLMAVSSLRIAVPPETPAPYDVADYAWQLRQPVIPQPNPCGADTGAVPRLPGIQRIRQARQRPTRVRQ